MGSTKEINIKDRTYYFYNDIIDLKTFDSKNLKVDKKRTIKNVTIKKIGDCYDVNSVNPLYLCVNNASRYIEEKGWSDKYLVFDSTDKNKDLLEKHNDVFNGLIDKIKKIDDDRLEYTKGYMKIKFNSDDILPLNKTLKIHTTSVTISCVISEDNKLYPQVFLDEALYSL